MQYFDLIFTNHAQSQIKARGISLEEVYDSFKNPTRTAKGKYGGEDFEKDFKDYKITVACAQNKKSEWIVKSAWRNPPLPGTLDAKKRQEWERMKKAGFGGKIYLTIKHQLGL